MTPLASVIEEEISQVSLFMAILNKEQEILKSGKPEGLSDLVQQKTALTSAIDQLEQKRSSLINRPDLIGNSKAIGEWIAQAKNEEQAAVLWQRLLAIASQAKDIHEQNGRLVNLLLRQTKDAISILLQHQQQNTFYSSNGLASTGSGSRIVDSA